MDEQLLHQPNHLPQHLLLPFRLSWSGESHPPKDNENATPAWIINLLLFFSALRTLTATVTHAASSWIIGILCGIFTFIIFVNCYNELWMLANEAIHLWLYGFTTRRLRSWTWLPENGAKEDFDTVWSSMLAIITIFSGPAVVMGYYWVISRPTCG